MLSTEEMNWSVDHQAICGFQSIFQSILWPYTAPQLFCTGMVISDKTVYLYFLKSGGWVERDIFQRWWLNDMEISTRYEQTSKGKFGNKKMPFKPVFYIWLYTLTGRICWRPNWIVLFSHCEKTSPQRFLLISCR